MVNRLLCLREREGEREERQQFNSLFSLQVVINIWTTSSLSGFLKMLSRLVLKKLKLLDRFHVDPNCRSFYDFISILIQNSHFLFNTLNNYTMHQYLKTPEHVISENRYVQLGTKGMFLVKHEMITGCFDYFKIICFLLTYLSCLYKYG